MNDNDYSLLIKKIEKIITDNLKIDVRLKKYPKVLTINDIANQLKLPFQEIEKIVYKFNLKNDYFYQLASDKQKDLLGVTLENKTFLISRKTLLQMIVEYLLFIKKILSFEEFFLDETFLAYLQKKLQSNKEKIKKKLTISEIDLFTILYEFEKNSSIDIFFLLRLFKIIIIKSLEEINKENIINNIFFNLYDISNILYFFFLNVKKKNTISEVKFEKKKIKQIIEKYLIIDAYQDKKNILIPADNIFSLKVNSTQKVSDFYTKEEINLILKEINNVFPIVRSNNVYLIHKYRVSYVSFLLLSEEEKNLNQKIKTNWNNKIQNTIFFNKKKFEFFLYQNISSNFKQILSQIEKSIYQKYQKEKFYQFVHQDINERKELTQEQLNYIKKSNNKEKINHLFNLYEDLFIKKKISMVFLKNIKIF